MTETKVIINYLPAYFRHAELFQFLDRKSKGLVRCNIVRNSLTGESLSYGFATYKDVPSAAWACVHLSGVRIDNKIVQITLARPQEEGYQKTAICVTSFPMEWSEDNLEAYFTFFGPVLRVNLLRNKYSGVSTGKAFVYFLNRQSANAATFYHEARQSGISVVRLGVEKNDRSVLSHKEWSTVAIRDSAGQWNAFKLFSYFCNFGLVTHVSMIPSEGLVDGLGLVIFNNSLDATKAVTIGLLLGFDIKLIE